MEDTIYHSIKEIREIRGYYSSDTKGEQSPEAQVNQLLQEGWILLAIHRRGYAYPEDGGHDFQSTVYILGQPSANRP